MLYSACNSILIFLDLTNNLVNFPDYWWLNIIRASTESELVYSPISINVTLLIS